MHTQASKANSTAHNFKIQASMPIPNYPKLISAHTHFNTSHMQKFAMIHKDINMNSIKIEKYIN